MKKFLMWLYSTYSDLFKGSKFRSKKPWAKLEIVDIEEDGQLKLKYSHNEAFIQYLKSIKWDEGPEDDMVQSYLLSLGVMAAIAEGNDNMINPDSHPELTNDANKFIR